MRRPTFAPHTGTFNFYSPNHPEVCLRCTGPTDCCNNRSDEISLTIYVVIIYIYSYLSKRWEEDSNLWVDANRPINQQFTAINQLCHPTNKISLIGFEPTTSAFVVRHSFQLSYRDIYICYKVSLLIILKHFFYKFNFFIILWYISIKFTFIMLFNQADAL